MLFLIEKERENVAFNLSITNVFSKFQNSYFSLKNFKEINFSSWKFKSMIYFPGSGTNVNVIVAF